MTKMFYIQTNATSGNSALWWSDDFGKTVDIRDAGVFTETQAKATLVAFPPFRAWPVEQVNKLIQFHVDARTLANLRGRRSRSGRYYIQDTRVNTGHSATWWCHNRNGYSVELRNAGIYEEDEASQIEKFRDTDKRWPIEKIKEYVQFHIDIQDLRALENGEKRNQTHVLTEGE